ncbi:MAG: hypothetical protein Kow00106_03080 [Anaerolineae bacterium]
MQASASPGAWRTALLPAAALILAGVLLVAYALSAAVWLDRPFLGAFFQRDLTVSAADSLVRESWPARQAGLRGGDRLLTLDGQELDALPVSDRLSTLYDRLDSYNTGETVTVRFLRRSGDAPVDAECSLTPQGERVCSLALRLSTLPLGDLAAYFLPGWLSGLLVWLAGVILLARRPTDAAVRSGALVAATWAVILAGQFETVSTGPLAWTWPLGLALAGAALGMLALEFPYRPALLLQTPALRLAPWLAGLAAGVSAVALSRADDPALNWLGTGIGLGALLVAGLLLLITLLWRRRRITSPLARNQSGLLATGLIPALVPFAVWLGALVVRGEGVPALAVPNGILPVLLPLSLFLALTQARLVDADRLAARAILYGALIALLSLSYFLLVAGLAALLGRSADDLAISPVLLVVAVFAVTLAFNPLRDTLQRRIETLYFRKRQAYQPVLERFARAMVEARGLADITRLVLETLEDTLAPSHAVLFARDMATGHFYPQPDPRTGQAITDLHFEPDSGLLHALQQQAGVLYLAEGRALPLELVGSRASLAVLGTPVLVGLGGQVGLNALLAVGPRRNGVPYDYDDLRFVESLRDQAALALERVQAATDLERRMRVQDVLSQVSRALNFAVDLDTLLELIYAQTRRVIDAPVFAIVLRDMVSDELTYVFYNEGEDRLPEMEGRRWPLGDDLVSEVARTQQALRTDDYAREAARRIPQATPDNPRLKAWMGVPLVADPAQGVLGVMIAAHTAPGALFTDEQRNLLWDIANLTASAIDKLQLFTKTEQRARQLAAINEIANQLASEMGNVDRLLQLITENAVQILGAGVGTLLLLDEGGESFEVRVVVGGDQEQVGTRQPAGEGLAGETVRAAQPIIVNAPSNGAGQMVPAGTACLSVPLLASGRAIGVLQVFKGGQGAFAPEDAEILSTFAGQAAVAIENARLFDMTDQQLALRVQELDTMQRIDYELNRTLDLQRVVDIMIDWALRKSGASACAFFMRDRERGVLQRVASYGYPPASPFSPTAEQREFPDDQGVLGRVVRTAKPSLVTDLALDPDYQETLPGCVAQLTVPLFSAGQVIGVILLESDREGELDLLDLDFIARLVEHATPALVNSQLFQELQRANQAKSEFVSFIAHELKNPMTSMKGYTDLLLKGVVGPVNPQQSDFLHTIYNNVVRMEKLVSDLNDLTKQQTNNLRLEIAPVSFAEVVTETLRSQQRMIDEKEQTVTVDVPDDLPLVLGDRVRLVQIMTNFVSNANKYTPTGGTLTIRARATRNIWDPSGAPEVVHCMVQDTGIGMSEEDLRHLFTPYFRSDNPDVRDQPGTGLGLTITRGLIEQHGGKIWVESTLGEGTTFHFTIPVVTESVKEGG